MPDLTYAELFAGAGGLSLGLELAGWQAVAHAEIEPHARAVLRKHWPDVRLDGDVSAINGADYAGVTLLSGGSPCQDLSIAGKRAGLAGARSGLFHQQVRIWQESGAPYFLWENVLGALSSNNGEDFACVLSAIVGASVPVPASGWGGAGVASGPAGVAAWRVLDCQYFGPPQRRRRVFVLGARTGGVDPAEVLALGEGVRGHPAPGGAAGQGAAADSGSSVEGAFGIRGTITGRSVEKGGPGGLGVTQSTAEPIWTLAASEVHSVLTYDTRGNGDGRVVNTMAGDHQNRVTDYTALVIDKQGAGVGDGVAPTLKTDLAHQMGPIAVTLRNREGKPGGGKGPLVSAGRSLTPGSANDQVLFTGPVIAPSLAVGGHGGGGDGQDAPQVAAAILAAQGVGIPRRLMPIETERLQGWPDGWTAIGVDERGREYALSDTARYKLVGNGCAAPVVGWIGWRLRWALESAR